MATDNPLLGGGGEIDDWATETTQKELKKLLEKKLSKFDASKIEKLLVSIEKNTKALTKVTKTGGSGGVDFTKLVKSLELGGAAAGGTGGKKTKSENIAKAIGAKFTPGGEGGGGGPVGVDSKVASIQDKLKEGAKKAGSGLFNLGMAIPKSLIGLAAFTAVMGALGGYVAETIDGYRKLIGVGQDFGGSMLKMRREAAQAGMGFATFSNVMLKHSKIVKAVGNESFITLQRQVRRINNDFGQFGFTVEETATVVADYAERQIRAGRLESLSESQRAIGVQKYMFQLTALSKITGRHRDEMMKDIKAISENVDITTATSLMTEEGAKRFREGLDKAGPAMTAVSGEFADSLTDLVAKTSQFGNIGMSSFGKVASIVGGEFSQGVEGFTSALKRGESGSADLVKVYGSLSDMTGETAYSIGVLARSGDQGAIAIQKMRGDLLNMSDTQQAELAKQLGMSEEALEKQLAQQRKQLGAEQKVTAQILAMSSKWDAFTGDIANMLLMNLGPAIMSAVGWIMDFVDNARNYITPFIPLITEVFSAMYNYGGKVVDFFVKFYKLMDEIGVIWLLSELGKALMKIVTTVYDIGTKFFDALGGLIDGIRRFVYKIKHPIDALTMSTEQIDEALGIGTEIATATIAAPEFKGVEGVAPGSVAPTGAAAGGNITGAAAAGDNITGAAAMGGAQTPEMTNKLIAELQELVKQGNMAQAAREAQLKQLKNLSAGNKFGFND